MVVVVGVGVGRLQVSTFLYVCSLKLLGFYCVINNP